MDVDTVAPGVDFVRVIGEAVANAMSCLRSLADDGRTWLVGVRLGSTIQSARSTKRWQFRSLGR